MATYRRRRFRTRALLLVLSVCTAANFFVSPDAVRAALLPALPAAPADTGGVLGIADVPLGIQQTTDALNQVVTAVQGLGASIQGVAAPDVEAQVAAIQASIALIQADIAALDSEAAQAHVMDAVGAIQAQVLALGLSTGLTSGLSIAQNVLSPVCALLAVPTSFVPGLGMDLTRTYKLKYPEVRQIDQTTDKLIKDTYDTVYNQALALLGANATTAAVPALLSLLKFDWTTTYEGPTGALITKKAPGLINIPTPLDVDNSGTFDVCAMAGYALDASGAVVMKQTITKMPLAKAVLPLRIEAPMVLGLLTVGYDTTKQAVYDTDPSASVDNSQSTAPVAYSATTSYASALTSFTTSLAVHRGTTLTLPPVEFNKLPKLPKIKPLTEPAPTPKLTQNLCLLTCGTLNFANRYDNPANALSVSTTTPAAAAQNLSFSGNVSGDLYKLTYALLGGLQSVVSKTVPAPTSLTYCSSTTKGTCSNSPHSATDTGSLKLVSSSTVKFDNSATTLVAPTSTCSTRASDVHVTGSRLTMSNTPANATTPGKVFVDTAGTALSGCVGYPSAATGIPAASFPAGFAASNRDSTYHLSGTTPIPDAKTGAATCPALTSFTLGSSTPLTAVVCPVLPTITAGPTITGEAVAEAPLVATSTWSPVADSPNVANSPTLTYQWSRCAADGSACSPISGATGSIYNPAYGGGAGSDDSDIGHAIRVTIRGTNIDGTKLSDPSAPTAPIADQTEAPGIVNLPTIEGVAGTGRTLTAKSSTLTDWSHGVSGALAYQWQKCDNAGANCADIADATGSTYSVAYPGDLDSNIQVLVTATNHVGSTTATSAQKRIQPAPVNTAVGTIQRCVNAACTTATAIPGSPFTGDKLKVTDGTWQAGTANAFSYQWFRCSDTGVDCAAIAGANTNRYTVSKADDLGQTLKATVTATNDNLDENNVAVQTVTESALTAVVTPAKPAVQAAPAVDGVVNSAAASGRDTTYVGGVFDTVGPAAGGAGGIGLAAGATQGQLANAANVTGGVVKAVASDGAGGYFIGGNFTRVQNVSCPTFAHITSAGALDATYCNLAGIAGEVRAVATTSGSFGNASGGAATYTTVARVVIGGVFNTTSGSNLVYIDPATKAVSADALGSPNGGVNSLLHGAATTGSLFASPPLAITHPGRLYVGGDFTKVGSTVVNHVFRNNWSSAGPVNQQTSASSAALVHDPAFNVGVCSGALSGGECAGSVKALALSTGALLVGGSFDGAYKAADAPTARNNAAAFSLTTPFGVTTWNPNTNGPVNAIGVGYGGSATVPTAVFLGGAFTSAAGMAVQNAVAYGITSTGAVSAAPAAQMNGAPSTSWKPSFDGPVNAISAGASTSGFIAMAGAFKTADNASRNRISLYVNQTSASPAAATLQTLTAHAGNEVFALSRDTASRLLAGGAFKVLGGSVRNNVAEIGTAGVTPFVADTDGAVSTVGANSSNVYVAGVFTKVNGQVRSGLGAVKQSDNSVLADWAPTTNVGGVVNAIAASDDAVYVGGSFTDIGGASRSSLSALDPSNGTATGWNSGGVTGGAASVKALVLHGGNVLVGGSFTDAGGEARSNAAAINAASGNATAWNPGPDGTVNAITVDPDDANGVFLGGSFANAGGAARANVAKVNAAGGEAAAWQADTDGVVDALVVFSNNLYLTGAFTTTGGQANGSLSGVDATTAEVLDWQPSPSGAIRTMTLTTGGLIAIGGDFVTFNPPVTGTNANPVFSFKPGFALLG